MATTTRRTRPAAKRARKWSQHVTQTSDSLDLESGVFSQRSPRAIAASLKRSAERSTRRKSSPFRSAMSMLVFYENRGGKNLSAERRALLERAKDELRVLFDRPAKPSTAAKRAAARTTRRTATARSKRVAPNRPRSK